jgi:hypothetical protein
MFGACGHNKISSSFYLVYLASTAYSYRKRLFAQNKTNSILKITFKNTFSNIIIYRSHTQELFTKMIKNAMLGLVWERKAC